MLATAPNKAKLPGGKTFECSDFAQMLYVMAFSPSSNMGS